MSEPSRQVRAHHPDQRLEALRTLLRGYELDQVEPELAGERGEIAAFVVPTGAYPELSGRIREIAGEIRALGFDYIALDLKMTEALD